MRPERMSGPAPLPLPLEVAGNLAVLHRGLADAVVRPRLAALGGLGRRDLGHDVVQRRRRRAHRAGAAHVADGPVAHAGGERLLAIDELHVGRQRVEHAVAAEHLALVREVDRGHVEALLDDVLPHVELGPVAQREDAHVLAAADAPVVDAPQLGALAARVPLAEGVAEGEDALSGPRALLVAPRAAERRVEAVLLDRVEQRRRLEAVARGVRPGLLDHAAAVDRLLHRGDAEPLAELGHAAVAERDDLGEVVAGVDVHEREREQRRAERLLGQAQQHDRVLAAAEQQHRLGQLGGDLAHDVDRLGLEGLQVRQLVRAHAATTVSLIRIRSASHTTAPTATGAPRMTHAERSAPALLSTPSAEPSSPQPRIGRSTPAGTRPMSALPIHTPGTDPSRIVPMSAKSTLPPTQCARPAAHSMIAAWKTSVPTTRRGVRRKSRMSAGPISAPLPTEVSPRTTPSTAPIATARPLGRGVSGASARSRGPTTNSTDPSTASETGRSARSWRACPGLTGSCGPSPRAT